MPTFDEVKELTTSGALPERSAAMILSSLIEPTTFTSTDAFFLSYSDTTFLNSLSSRALQPTQTVSFVAAVCCDDAVDATAANAAASARTAATSAAVTRRLMRNLLLGLAPDSPRGLGPP